MDRHVILGVHITDRVKSAADVQKVFTRFGCNIKTRIGLHHVDDKVCSPNGLILLEVFGGEGVAGEMAAALRQVEGVQVQTMVFDHP